MHIRSRTPLHILQSTPAINLSPIEAQERYLLGIALLKRPCPVCEQPCHQVEACQGVFNLGNEGDSFACPSCGVALTVTVPFISSTPWFWSPRRG